MAMRQRRLLSGAPACKRDFLAAVGILFGVGQQIDDDLRQRVGIAAHWNRRGRQFAGELESGGLEMRTKRFRRGADHFRQIARLEIVFFLAAFHAREIEHVVDEPRQPRGLGRDDVADRSAVSRDQSTRPSASNSENMRMEVSGVFNSCETLPTKSVFCRASFNSAPRLRTISRLPMPMAISSTAIEQAERELGRAGGLRELRRIDEIRGDFPMRQRLADLRWPRTAVSNSA